MANDDAIVTWNPILTHMQPLVQCVIQPAQSNKMIPTSSQSVEVIKTSNTLMVRGVAVAGTAMPGEPANCDLLRITGISPVTPLLRLRR